MHLLYLVIDLSIGGIPDLPNDPEDYQHVSNDNAWFAGLSPMDPIFVSLIQAGRVKKPFVYNCAVYNQTLSFSVVVPEKLKNIMDLTMCYQLHGQQPGQGYFLVSYKLLAIKGVQSESRSMIIVIFILILPLSFVS